MFLAIAYVIAGAITALLGQYSSFSKETCQYVADYILGKFPGLPVQVYSTFALHYLFQLLYYVIPQIPIWIISVSAAKNTTLSFADLMLGFKKYFFNVFFCMGF